MCIPKLSFLFRLLFYPARKKVQAYQAILILKNQLLEVPIFFYNINHCLAFF